MKKVMKVVLLGFIAMGFTVACNAASLKDNKNFEILKNFKAQGVTNEQCLSCHKEQDQGIVADWEHSKHATVGVGCVACHVVPKNYPTAYKSHPLKGDDWEIQLAVSSVTCAKCHAAEVTQFMNSGHARAGSQWLAGNKSPHGYAMTKLSYNYEGMGGDNPSLNGHTDMGKGIDPEFNLNQDNPKLAAETVANTCVQCHGAVITLNQQGVPNSEVWPNDGMGSNYPDGGISNCTACHSRHKFSAAEARQPAACASCHLGPDHPDIEIFESSVHGHILATNPEDYDFSTGEQIPGKTLRGPTCFTCHMSGINGLKPTHNISTKLKWNLWAPKSFKRTEGDETAGWDWYKDKKLSRGNPKAGNPKGPEAARSDMMQVCSTCHQTTFVDNYFARTDAQVTLYNQYNTLADQMLQDLKSKGLIKADLWSDTFFKLYYYSWHHEGRRMRQGAAMGSPDYSHWHGSFEVMQDIREMKALYNYRLKLLAKYKDPKKVFEEEVPMPMAPHD
ncbi:multiheme c-type cytochrome [Geopsychrobacter electrodiphilus]|uniref:multiheme c-type cytochrome n=1 Tax=Geopsychrobacter electrodiphilus TaxID=225196 RepID=UPI0003634378|nr:multiheme c-type cytochrome [Geopsychrobacter electrodiphilus]